MNNREFYSDILRTTAEVQASLPTNPKHTTYATISRFPSVYVNFPTHDASLSKFHHSSDREILEIPEIVTSYRQQCQQLQDKITQHFQQIVQNLKSLEKFGGPSDLTLQSDVAQGLSHLYSEWEQKLADGIILRYRKSVTQIQEGGRIGKKVKVDILRKAFAAKPHPTDAERDYLAKETGMTYRQVTIWFQNARSRRINALPKRSLQQSSRQPLASPPQTASTMASLHEVEQHLRNATDSPLAQHVTLPDSKDPYHQLRLPTPPPFKSTLRAVEDNSGMVRSFSGIAEEGVSTGDAPRRDGKDVQTRKIKPLRKSRLAGKKAATVPPAESCTHDAISIQREQNGLPSLAPLTNASIHVQQLNPSDVLDRALEKSRVPSNSSISSVDSLLDGNPSHYQIFQHGPDGVLALPLSALDKRTVSGSSAGQVDASLAPEDGLKDMQPSKMIPMFNFQPPTPSNAGFAPSVNLTADTSHGTHSKNSCETPFTFEPLDLRTIFGSARDDAERTADELSRELSDLDYEEFLTSPGTSTEGSPELAQGSFEADSSSAEDVSSSGVPDMMADSAHIKYIFDQMDAQSKAGDGMDIDPAIFEMLKEILMGGAVGQNGSFEVTEKVPPPPHSTSVTEDASSTSRPLSEYDPSLAALAIDMSSLMGLPLQDPLCVQTTPSDISEMTAFEDREGDAVSLVERPDALPGSGADRLLMENDGKAVEWEGLLDFGDMFDAFWKMVDGKEGEESAGQSLSHA
ncbi:hypothetical protein NliqN6_3504 [Naganishia liquefaciens]|uniref:Homeobox domain-containing protein n=1 Tax=Naganishia liquefaciens TaxID=104408 RepID=A0A8H3YGC7_9TREE|nr:hypothetical protein NliqN6_3504 [Naganishia liquefaciens]